jgi:DNA-binding NarL/FixJ family response regulator
MSYIQGGKMNLNLVKLYLADDHQILIDGLISFFNEIKTIEVVGTANDGSTLIREIHKKQPDIILLDLNMPKLDGVKTLERLKKEYPWIKVIILSNYHQSQFIKDARENGASGYVLKNGSKKELLDAIEIVKNGGQYFNIKEPEIADTESNQFKDDFIKQYQLTKREIEVIKLICNELSTRQISDKLFISEYTVNTHRKNILRKLDVKNSAGMINFARQHGLI